MSDEDLPGWAWYEVAKLRSDLDSVLNRVVPLVAEHKALPEAERISLTTGPH